MSDIGFPDTWRALLGVNLNHLLYFWAVGRSGSMTAAATAMGVSQPSVSEQVRALEQRLGATLLRRTGRGVELTAAGERAMRYAEEAVGICGELVRSLPVIEREEVRPIIVGATDAVPKIVVRSLLEPLLQRDPPIRILLKEWRVDHLLSELSLHRLDLVISDLPIDPSTRPGLRSVHAGYSNVTLCADAALARRLKRGFPRSLDGAPVVLPVQGIGLRAALDRWFALRRISPRALVETEDRGLLHHFAERGYGAVAVATSNLAVLRRQFGLFPIAELPGVRDDYYVVTIDRTMQHPAVGIITDLVTSRSVRPRGARAGGGSGEPARRRGRAGASGQGG